MVVAYYFFGQFVKVAHHEHDQVSSYFALLANFVGEYA